MQDFIVIVENVIKVVMPAKAGIQRSFPPPTGTFEGKLRWGTSLLIILDSPVSSTGQAQSRASLARNDKTT